MGDDGWLFEDFDPLTMGWVADAPWFKANMRSGHRFLVRTSSGVAHWQASMGRVTSTGNTAAANALRVLFYGDPEKNPDDFTGFAQYYNTRMVEKAANAINVLTGRAVQPGQRRSSIWLVGWGPKTIHMVSPDGEPPVCGFCEMGLVIKDWRFAARAANIDHETIDDIAVGLRSLMSMLPLIGRHAGIRPMFYMNRGMRKALEKQSGTVVELAKDAFCGIPIRVVDELRDDEELVI